MSHAGYWVMIDGPKYGLLVVAAGLCTAGCASTSTYTNIPSGIEIAVRDSGQALTFLYVGQNEGWQDGDGRPEEGTRCGYLARIVVCQIMHPSSEQLNIPTSDGGRVEGESLGDGRWRFVYYAPRSVSSDCSYALWAPASGVGEFGVTTCGEAGAPVAQWILRGNQGFFVGDGDKH